MTGDRLTLEVTDGIAHLVLCAPPRNEMTLAFFDELTLLRRGAFRGLDARGMVVRGQGRHFSSGADIAELTAWIAATPEEQVMARLSENVENLEALAALPFPVVAAISGCCFGVGLEMALACDYRVASERAVLALPEAEFGLMPGAGGSVRLARLVGGPAAARLVLSGRTVGAREALDLGLVDAVHDGKALLDAAIALIDGARGDKKLLDCVGT
jgi:enoyl-CoA hydratase/carnithine racemase